MAGRRQTAETRATRQRRTGVASPGGNGSTFMSAARLRGFRRPHPVTRAGGGGIVGWGWGGGRGRGGGRPPTKRGSEVSGGKGGGRRPASWARRKRRASSAQ